MGANDDVKCLLTRGQRNFGFMSIVGFSCTLMITWEGLLVYTSHLKYHSSRSLMQI